MRLRLIRHATLVVEIGGLRLLVDPLLSPAEALPPVEGTPNARPNPLVPLPPGPDPLAGLDAALVTHLHSDHFDPAAAAALPRALTLACQPPDEPALREQGFHALHPVASTLDLDGLTVTRTDGRHGTGAIGERMAPVSGFVLEAPGEPRLYLAGDTVWCDEVAAALATHRAEVVVVNAGAARFLEGDPITMTAADVVATARAAPDATLVAVHLEAVNHCLLSRAELRDVLRREGLQERVLVPEDGETLAFSS